jgi:hypothetical protein
MSAWNSWSSWAGIPAGTERLTRYSINADIDRQATYDNMRDVVSASWEYVGADEATARWMVDQFRASRLNSAAYPLYGAYIALSEPPVEDASTLKMWNLRRATEYADKILAGWKFRVDGDDQIYTVTADANLPTAEIAETQLLSSWQVNNNTIPDVDIATDALYRARWDVNPSTGKYWVVLKRYDGLATTHPHSTGTVIGTYAPTEWWNVVQALNVNTFVDVSAGYAFVDIGNFAIVRFTLSTGATTAILNGTTQIHALQAQDSAIPGLFVCDPSAGLLSLYSYGGTKVVDIYNAGTAQTMFACAVGNGQYDCYYTRADGYYYYDHAPTPTSTKLTSAEFFPARFDNATGRAYTIERIDGDDYLIYGPADLSIKRIVTKLDAYNSLKTLFHISSGRFFYSGEEAATFSAGYDISPVTVSITPAVTETTADIGVGGKIYFFKTTGADASRADPSHQWTIKIDGQYTTEWIQGPPTEE